MKSARMTKQVKSMVTFVNGYLKANRIKNLDNNMFGTMQALLLEAGCYHGYNYFTTDGFLSGGENEKFDHLEFYIV